MSSGTYQRGPLHLERSYSPHPISSSCLSSIYDIDCNVFVIGITCRLWIKLNNEENASMSGFPGAGRAISPTTPQIPRGVQKGKQKMPLPSISSPESAAAESSEESINTQCISREQLEALMDNAWKDDLRPPAAEDVPSIVSRCKEHSTPLDELPSSTVLQIRGALPSQEHANYLCERAKTLSIWLNLGAFETYSSGLMAEVYDPMIPACPYRLAALLSLLALGLELSCVDEMVSQVALSYHELARAALCLLSAGDDTEIHLMMSLFFSALYLMVFYDDKEHLGHARGILNVSARLTEKLQFDRDKYTGKFLGVAGQQRRLVYWELTCLDVVLTLGLKDRPSFPLQEPDNRSALPPSFSGPAACIMWRQQFYTRCSVPALLLMNASPPPKYTSVVKLDATVRDFPIPLALRMPSACGSVSDAESRQLIGQRAYVSIQRDFLLIQLHRSYFLQAIDNPEMFSSTHPYICSVLATFQNACQIISCVETVVDQAPEACRRIACLWTQVFGAAVGLCFIVSKIPSDPLATLSARQLDKSRAIFRKATQDHMCRKAREKYSVLEGVVQRSMEAYYSVHARLSPSDNPSPTTFLPKQTQETLKRNLGAADPYAHVHPILMRLLQQARARARALRSEGALSSPWSSSQAECTVPASIAGASSSQPTFQSLGSLPSSLAGSPHDWTTSEPIRACLTTSSPSPPFLPESVSPSTSTSISSAVQHVSENASSPMSLNFKFTDDVGVNWLADVGTGPFDRQPGGVGVSDMSLDLGLGPFDLLGGNSTPGGTGCEFMSFGDPTSFVYEFSLV
ncbi:hypothetical protein K488DRAFT_89009 [Vararia minispora EC-137]|uniref:Uncharacterized protein n=1 Tax=Vararia minispora EC-137 TaxID=1314806 RepID=A0ACB8QBK0_9AGAM|nr:hypothetical protein K488DRAFT_89009 [Vararia minispora EC-137]